MDRETLETHRNVWGQEPVELRYTGDVSLSTEAERALFEDLRHDVLGERVRLEQERISYGRIRTALSALPQVSSWTP
jgi:hypothetical protein